jgi:phage tail-like protein
MTAPKTTEDAGANKTAATVDPLGELAFKIEIQGRTIGRFAECSGLAVEYDVEEYVEGGNNGYVHHLRGGMRFPNVTLQRGITYEDELLQWFYATEKVDKRPVVTITMLDTLGASVRHFALSSALPVRWTGPTVRTGGTGGAATESLEIAHRGFV